MIGMVVGCHGVLVVMMCGYRGVVVVTGLVVMVFRLSQCLVAAVFGCQGVWLSQCCQRLQVCTVLCVTSAIGGKSG